MDAPDRDALLDECLQPSRIPRWLARAVSWPARDLAALDRVLKLGGELDDAGAARRALLSTPRQLPEAGGAVRLERGAAAVETRAVLRRDARADAGPVDAGLRIGRRGDDFRSGATTSPCGDGAGAGRAEGLELQNPKMAGAGAFQALAGYIFGGNGREEKMAMTTPVFRSGDMEFVLPEAYWSDAPGRRRRRRTWS
ncbi:Heme-binding protein [Aureococcus anophagefferens]|nr:Heme-binding protein [Aureococcus anophagefferens]